MTEENLVLVFQVLTGISAHSGAPQQPVVPDGGDGGPAEGPDAAEQQRSAQTAAETHRVYGGEAADQLDVHLPLWLPAGLFSCKHLGCSVEPIRSSY